MNREMKFRAWDEDSKNMIYDKFTMNSHGEVLYTQYGEIMGVLITYKLMQYTGLKDKYGTEIYEGDIYKNPKGVLIEIYFNQDNCAFKGRHINRNHQDGDLLNENGRMKGEVIGNIYENPELFED